MHIVWRQHRTVNNVLYTQNPMLFSALYVTPNAINTAATTTAAARHHQHQHRSHFEMAIAIFSGTRCFAYKNIFIIVYRVLVVVVVMGDSSFFINSFIVMNESKHRYGWQLASMYKEGGGLHKKENACVARKQQIFSMQLSENSFSQILFNKSKNAMANKGLINLNVTTAAAEGS